jgi:uncharacterized membrane protein YiaA
LPAPVDPLTHSRKEIIMEPGYFLAALSLFTFVAVIIVAMVSKKKTQDRLHDPAAHQTKNKSTLAKDAPNEHR